MSDPVSNAEIEDVLSSIRRLISENASIRRPAAVEGRALEKLVLTPAFRVGEPAAEDAPDTERESARKTPEPGSLEERIAELEAAVGRRYDDWEPDGSEYVSQAPEEMIFTPADAASGWEEDPWAADEKVETTAAESAGEATRDAWISRDPGAEDMAGVDSTETEDTGGLNGTEAEEAASWENDPELFQDDVEENTAEAGWDPEETVLDEEALREMVARLVRDELQGAVGERITRNVRRLVRREIQRALSLKEFE
jgi:cell pole-organizing protein PopZ